MVRQAVVKLGILSFGGHRQYGKDVSNLFQDQDGSLKIVSLAVLLEADVRAEVGISNFPFVDEKLRTVFVDGLFQLVPLVKMLHPWALVKLHCL